MKKPFNAFLFFLLFIFSVETNAQKYTDMVEGFEIFLPEGTFDTKIDTIETELGEIIYKNYYAAKPMPSDTLGENYFYSLGICSYPEQFDVSDTATVNLIIDQSIKELTFNMNGKLFYQAQDDYYDNFGKIFRIVYNKGNAILKGKIFLIEKKLYVLQVATIRKYSLNRKMDSFLDSFKILEKTKN